MTCGRVLHLWGGEYESDACIRVHLHQGWHDDGYGVRWDDESEGRYEFYSKEEEAARRTVAETSPAQTGPMKGQWRPDLIRDLGRLRVLAARAMDAAQVGGQVPEEFVEVAERVLAQVRSSACCGIQCEARRRPRLG